MPGIVHVVDDDASYRTAIQRLLEMTGYRVVTHASAQQLLDQRPDENAGGCILLDVRMPGLSGPELQSRLTELGWTLPIVFLTGHPDISTTVKAIKAGADNFLIKPVSQDELLRAIETAIARHETERALKSELEALRARLSTLTPRQRQVFEIIVRGKTNKHAARELGGSERTIKAHRQVIMEKMKVQSLAQLVTIAERLGVLQGSGPGDQNQNVDHAEHEAATSQLDDLVTDVRTGPRTIQTVFGKTYPTLDNPRHEQPNVGLGAFVDQHDRVSGPLATIDDEVVASQPPIKCWVAGSPFWIILDC